MKKADLITHVGMIMVKVGTLESVKEFMQKLAYKKVEEVKATLVAVRARDFDGLVHFVKANAVLKDAQLSAAPATISLGNPTPAPAGSRDRRLDAIDGITALLAKYPETGYAATEWYSQFNDLCWAGSGFGTELRIIWNNSRCANNDMVRLALQMLRDRISQAIKDTPVEVLNR